ncbi:hypothetical protein [Oscillibacter ruminantium]|jgi:hypothetical protein|uniref:hypothetical protein n=1 Tax=Oscillibacter ruminantium TaxID=1263547 RepID=UPI0002E8DECF|nr:hypothetical protein [Oscillibacter ruminantium]
MEQNNLEKSAGFLSEIGIVLRRDGYDTSVPDNGLLPILADGLPLCRISETGSVRYRDADIGSLEREDALHEVTQTAETVSEYMKLMDAAPLLKAQGLDETYRLLADFNGVVLAGHSSRLGVQFVTWDWDYERTGVSQGHYMSNHYEAAKKDFAVRSGLVWKQQLFSPEHLTEIYRCVQDTLVHLYNLTYDREKCLGKIQEQITNLVPDLQQRIAQAQPQEESAFTEPTM